MQAGNKLGRIGLLGWGEDTSEFVFQISEVTFPSLGEYRLKRFPYHEFLIERRLILVQTAEGGQP